MARYLYNLFYTLNPLPSQHAEYAPEYNDEVPVLPDLTQTFSPYSFLGNKKQIRDPRFPMNNSDSYKKCFVNFAVWRKCLEEHTEDYDESVEEARLCRKFKNLAVQTCPAADFKNLREAAERDAFVALLGLNSRKPDANPTIVLLDDEHTILEVKRGNSKDPRKWKAGDSLH